MDLRFYSRNPNEMSPLGKLTHYTTFLQKDESNPRGIYEREYIKM